MKNILLLSRPIINAGDFLFSEKSLETIKMISPETKIITDHISKNYPKEFLDNFDAVVVAGGPLYDDRFLTYEAFPLLQHISSMRPQIAFLSNGWYGKDASAKSIYSFRFSDKTLKLLYSIENEWGGVYSARDFVTAAVLRNNGLQKVSVVGCTAWYDHKYMPLITPRFGGKIADIIISDQGITKEKRNWTWKFNMVEDLINIVQMMFPQAHFFFTFNGGINTKYSSEYNHQVCSLLEKKGIPYKDISGSSTGFKYYDKADLHVGFRMHSHIYCMSKRIPSILVGEDARGSGLNQALGTPDILDYSYEDRRQTLNENLGKQLKDYIYDMINTDFGLLRSAYKKMNTIYENNFVPFVEDVCGRKGENG